MKTHNLGYPRIGGQRQLKKICEKYWAEKCSREELLEVAKNIRLSNWEIQKQFGIDLIPVNDFSFYDQVLDLSFVLGAIPDRYREFIDAKNPLELYFAMARGYQKGQLDVTAMEMTKWFDTNYHYIVPEFKKNQNFKLSDSKVVDEFKEAKRAGINAKPVLIGAVSYLLLGKEKEEGFEKIDLINNLLPVYIELLKKLEEAGASWVQMDEPYLAMDLTEKQKKAFLFTYSEIKKNVPNLKIIIANYFDCYGDNLETALSLPVECLHLDLARCPSQLDDVLNHSKLGENLILSLGIINGRNVWKNNFEHSLSLIGTAIKKIEIERIWIAPSCSLLHSPCDLDFEEKLDPEIKQWLAFAKQKLYELAILKQLATDNPLATEESLKKILGKLLANVLANKNRKESTRIHNKKVKKQISKIKNGNFNRKNPFSIRQSIQKEKHALPLFPTTTIGSFPQTNDVRRLRARLKKGELSKKQYKEKIKEEIVKAIHWQEKIGIDVLAHGEFERNDMVEYFGELLNGFCFTQNGWVQSYGSRCVKPPIIYGDVSRSRDISVEWSTFAQSQTKKLMKGMLTGPITILQWSFVRDDQSRKTTAYQIALAIREEVIALEKAGIKIIQIDEPAIREGLPLRKKNWDNYLNWAIKAFRLSSSGVNDETQIHTHMCYSEFNDIINHIANMDADVITIENSRSKMELLKAFADFKYPNEIGPGVYDIHSPRVPSVEEITLLLNKVKEVLPIKNIWVNPDCGLKTRKWEEVKLALQNMVSASEHLRKEVAEQAMV